MTIQEFNNQSLQQEAKRFLIQARLPLEQDIIYILQLMLYAAEQDRTEETQDLIPDLQKAFSLKPEIFLKKIMGLSEEETLEEDILDELKTAENPFEAGEILLDQLKFASGGN